MEKKGQAAMEFLMTYGWAILAAVIAIGVLVYFGVFSPGKLVPEMCTLSAPLGCTDDSNVSAADGVGLVIQNGVGEDISVSGIEVSGCGAVTYTPVSKIVSGVSEDYVIACTATTLVSGANFRGNIVVNYTKASSTRALESSGSISRKVTA